MASSAIYQFYAELNDYEPKIWRRFEVAKNITAAKLGYILMTMFEMQASHLFYIDEMHRKNFYKFMSQSFPIQEIEKMFPTEETKSIYRYEVKNHLTTAFDDKKSRNATEYKIAKLVSNSGDEIKFSYDSSDGWEVKVVLESVFSDEALNGKNPPRVIEGEGYGIIEDCGGPHVLSDFDLPLLDIQDMNFRLTKLPRIYANVYEDGLAPTKQSMKLIMREYKC